MSSRIPFPQLFEALTGKPFKSRGRDYRGSHHVRSSNPPVEFETDDVTYRLAR